MQMKRGPIRQPSGPRGFTGFYLGPLTFLNVLPLGASHCNKDKTNKSVSKHGRERFLGPISLYKGRLRGSDSARVNNWSQM